MRKLFSEESLHCPNLFVREVFARNDVWTWYLFGTAKKHQYHLVDDVLQEFYYAVMLKWAKIPKDLHATTMSFLFSMLRNEFINALRKQRQLKYLDDLRPTEHPGAGLHHFCYETLLQEHFSQLETLLPKLDFQILELKMQGYASKEIAEYLQVKTNYVDVRLHRIRKQLQPHFSLENG